MKWEAFVKLILCGVLQVCVIALLFVTAEATRTILYVSMSNLAWIITAWSIYEDRRKEILEQIQRGTAAR